MAEPVVLPISSTKFQLDRNIIFPGGSATVEVSAVTDHDVLEAILDHKPFPERPNGKIELGHIDLQAETGKTLAFAAGPGATVAFKASAEFKTGMGVFNAASDALSALQLQDAPALDLELPGQAGDRFLVMTWGYDASGSIEGSHPLGVLGTVTFGVEGNADSVYAVVHRFPANTDADRAIADTVSSWRLPRQVETGRDVKAGTWIIAEVDGTIAVQIAAQLGYDLNLIHQAQLLGLTRNLGAKIDAGLKATFGFSVSGRYLVVLGKDSDDDTSGVIRLRLYKQAKRGLTFGLNLSVGITSQVDMPQDFDDLVKAVFGVHGQQAFNDLHLLKQWTDPNADLGQLVSGLVNDEGLRLLTSTTGIDAKSAFNKARQVLLSEFQKWDALSEKVSTATWGILDKLAGAQDAQTFKDFLAALSDADPQKRALAFATALQDATFGATPAGTWLAALADNGLLALSNELDKVQPTAAQTLDILNGGIIKRAQDFIAQKLDLNAIRKAVTQNDFDTLDAWLVKRLGVFFDKDLHFEDLKPIQAAIHLVESKAEDIYAKARQALNSRYNFDFAATYMNTTTSDALLDVNFDLQQEDANRMFRTVVDDSSVDTLLVTQTKGVTLNLATLSHEIQRTATVQLNMPFFKFDSSHVNDSLAKLTAEEDSGRVLVYELDASDVVSVKNRYQSELSMLCSLHSENGQLKLGPETNGSIAYQMRQVKKQMSLVDFEHRVTPFIHENLSGLFSGGEGSLQTFYVDLDRTIENVLHNGANQFGDTALCMQVSVPGSVLASWFIPRSADRLKRDAMNLSRALQAKLREILPFYYLQDINRLRANPPVSALLVWSAMPISTSMKFQEGQMPQFNTDSDVLWDFLDTQLRGAMVNDPHTTAALVPMLLTAQTRLRENGDVHDAAFFAADQVQSFQSAALSGMGSDLLQSLLFTEAEIIRGAISALKDVNGMLSAVNTSPTAAIERFASFGADLTDTFNQRLSSVYGDDSLRTVSTAMLVEASQAIDPGASGAVTNAMLSILTLNNNHAFDLNDFISGSTPPPEQVAVAQTLVNLAH